MIPSRVVAAVCIAALAPRLISARRLAGTPTVPAVGAGVLRSRSLPIAGGLVTAGEANSGNANKKNDRGKLHHQDFSVTDQFRRYAKQRGPSFDRHKVGIGEPTSRGRCRLAGETAAAEGGQAAAWFVLLEFLPKWRKMAKTVLV
jgi:hypothetical protein